MEVDVAELDAIIDAAASGPLDEEQRQTLRSALHLLLAKLEPKGRTSERLEELIKKLMPQDKPDSDDKSTGQEKPGHGRNPSSAYWGAQRFVITHGTLQAGSHCPDCATGKVYPTKTPKTLLRIVAAPPVQAKAYDLERLRCNLCGETFVAEAPEGVGDKKYDATVPAMLAVLTYGSGFPRNRLTTLQGQLGVPMPQSTQWDLLDEAADQLEPLYREVVEHAAQGDVLHSDDTSRKVLKLERPPEDARTGVFTSGIVSTANGQGPRIALFFTGRQHAGENLRDILLRRAQELAQPLHMCDALSRNTPKRDGVAMDVAAANCLAHGRRYFVESFESFPEQCRHVLEELGVVFLVDRLARLMELTPAERLAFHQKQSGPVMESLKAWLGKQFEEKLVEPNSGLGRAIKYLQKHWEKLTLFLREPGAPVDNNLCERALKKAVLHRKNSLFFRTKRGAEVGDLFTSLVHTCELNKVNPFAYLTLVLRHSDEVKKAPADWLPWNRQEPGLRPPQAQNS